jgi:hypothetical protein
MPSISAEGTSAVEELTVRSLETPARDWRVQLGADAVLVAPDGETLRFTRADLDRVAELIPLWAHQAALTLRPPGRKKLQLKLTPDQRRSLETWLGPPSAEQLRVVLRRRYAFSVPLGILLLLTSAPLPGDPEQGIPPIPFDWLSAALGAGLLVIWSMGRLRPSPFLFVADSLWFGLLTASTLWNIYRDASSPWWLLLAGLCAWLSFSGVKQFKRYRHLAGRRA